MNHLAIAPAVLALWLLTPASSSAQLYTTTSDSGAWNSARWSTSSDGPFNSAWVSGSDTSFLTGNYTFDSMFSTTGTIGNITTGTNVTIGFTNSSSQQFVFGGAVKTFDLGAGSVVDFGSIALLGTGGNGLIKNGAGTLTLTGGNYQSGFTLNAGNAVARSSNGFGTGAFNINGGAIGSIANYTSPTARINGINIGGDFQIGISGSTGSASSTANMTFSGTGSTVNLTGATRKITLGSSGLMTFGGVISNGGLTLTRNSDGSIGSFSLTGINTFASGLTIDGVAVNASTNNEALGAGAVTLGGNSGFVSTLNLKSALTIANDMTIANTAGIKTITNSVANATINGTITNNDSTGGVVIGATTGRTFNIGGINGNGTTGVTFGGGTLVGTVVMNGAGTYTGNTVIDGSILRMSGAGSSVSAANLVFKQTGGSAVTPTFDLNGTQQTVAGLDDSAFAGIIRTTLSGGKLIVGDSNNSTFRGTIISGNSLELEKVGSGKLTLTGANTYTNGTTISGGELEVSSQSLRGDVINDARLTFNQAVGAGTFSGNISGTGSFFKNGGDALTLTGANSYSGGTTVTGGGLIGNTDALQGAIVNNAAVTFDQSPDGTYAGVMSGSGSFTKLGIGTVTLSGSNTYTGGTTVSAGSLVGTTTSLQGAIANNAAVTFDQSTAGTYAGVMSGNGLFTKLGSGAVTLTGANTYSGGTTVSAGSLFGTTSSLQGAITNNATVTFDQSTSGTYAGVMSGNGSLTKLGAGTVTLTGTNTYTGATTVTAGLLTVNGDSSSSALTTVEAGATLGGSGTIGALVVETGATIAPGNSPGTLTASGNVTWQAGGNYNWQLVDAVGTAGTGWDTLAISGVLDLTLLSSANPFNLNLWSLSSAGAVDGDAQNFDSGGNFSWTIATASGGITGFDAVDFFIQNGAINGTNGFTNDLAGGTFSLAVVDGNQLNLVYNGLSAVPEPGSNLALLALGAGGLTLRRRLKRAA